MLLIYRAESVAELETAVPAEKVVIAHQVVVDSSPSMEHGVTLDPRGQPVRKLGQRSKVVVEGVEVLEFHSTGWEGLKRDIRFMLVCPSLASLPVLHRVGDRQVHEAALVRNEH